MSETGTNGDAEQPPTADQARVPAYVALVRIAAVIGMSTALAFGLFLLVGGAWLAGLISCAIAIPFFFLMRLVENVGAPEEDTGRNDEAAG